MNRRSEQAIATNKPKQYQSDKACPLPVCQVRNRPSRFFLGLKIMQILPPNSRDIVVIQDFLKTISWASECTLCQPVGRDRVWLNVSNLYVLVPTDCEGYPNNLEEVKLASSTLGVKPGVIFYGNPTDYRRDEMNCTAHEQELVIYWTGAENRIRYSSWLRKISDGIDLVKIFFEEANNRRSHTNLIPFRPRRPDN